MDGASTQLLEQVVEWHTKDQDLKHLCNVRNRSLTGEVPDNTHRVHVAHVAGIDQTSRLNESYPAVFYVAIISLEGLYQRSRLGRLIAVWPLGRSLGHFRSSRDI